MSQDTRWYSTLSQMPMMVEVLSEGSTLVLVEQFRVPIPCTEVFTNEKEAIIHARQLRVAEVDRLTAEINQLSERLDQIESDEVTAEAATEDYMPEVKL